jgi:6-methylsalicylate decarboxylase
MGCSLTHAEILDDFKTFYFDTALASDSCTLEMMQKFVGPERLLFGTDLPGEKHSLFSVIVS